MWSFLAPRNLLDFQREAAVRLLGEQARRYLLDGYRVDADRVLDEMLERRREWEQPQP